MAALSDFFHPTPDTYAEWETNFFTDGGEYGNVWVHHDDDNYTRYEYIVHAVGMLTYTSNSQTYGNKAHLPAPDAVELYNEIKARHAIIDASNKR